MYKLNISKCIVQKRREKGITQEKLAEYLGVTKASVSKWESGLSYPDILMLPELATYFNVSVDELLGYSPQLTSEDIKKLYNQLSHDFAVKPFEEVREQCDQIIKKYYSCFPLLLAMTQLLLNHAALTPEAETKKAMLLQSIALSQRVKEESDSIRDAKNANSMEAMAQMALGNIPEVIRLLDDQLIPYSGDDVMLLMAHQMLGENDKARQVNQVMLFQNVIQTLTLLTNYISLNMTEPQRLEQIYEQGKQLIEAFEMQDILTNAVYGIHIAAAQGYLLQQQPQKAIQALEQYVEIISGLEYPLKLKGNQYFDQVDEWLEENVTIGSNAPIDDMTVKNNFIMTLEANPAFAPLRDEEEFKQLLQKLKNNLGVKTA